MSQFTSLELTAAVAAIVAGLASASADARSTTGFSAFHVESPISSSQNAYQCLTENNGAVVNNCAYPVSLEFDLPIDNTGNHIVYTQDFPWYPSNFSDFSCTAYAYSGNQLGVAGTAAWFSTYNQTINPSVNASANGMSIQLICWNIPTGEGIANLNWSA